MYNIYYEGYLDGVLIKEYTGELKTIPGVWNRFIERTNGGEGFNYVIFYYNGGDDRKADSYEVVERRGDIRAFFEFWV